MTIALGLLDPTHPVARTLCPDCGAVQRVPRLTERGVAECARCGSVLARGAAAPVAVLLALGAGALMLYLPATFLPLLSVDFIGDRRYNILATGAQTLVQEGFWPLGTVVFLFTVLMPLLWLVSFTAVLSMLATGRRPRWIGGAMRLAEAARPWAMPEVFLVGGFVAYTRLGAIATPDIGIGGWAFLAYAGIVLVINAVADRDQIWEAILPSPDFDQADPVFACHACNLPLIAPAGAETVRCRRCGARVARRKPESFHACAALVIAAYILYIPANFLPIMTILSFGTPDRNTILSGALELLHYGFWPLALIVFLASIAIPLIKLLGLTWCLLSVYQARPGHLALRTRLYRFVEAVGRWSNIDVFMMSILAALIDYGNLARISAEPGALAFAAVIILTMIASRSFDPRSMWDEPGARA